jgi:hypothetical protein
MSEAELSTTTFSAEVALGDARAPAVPYPAALPLPRIAAEWLVEDTMTLLEVEIGDAALHLEYTDDVIVHHFHEGDGDESPTSPWPRAITQRLLAWAAALAVEVGERMPHLDFVLDSALDTFEQGMTVHIDSDHDGERIDFVQFAVEQPVKHWPWPGNGVGEHHHLDDNEDRVELGWDPGDGSEHIHIAAADDGPGGLHAWAFDGVDWSTVGLTSERAVAWLVGEHVNCLALDVIRTRFRSAVFCRLGGVGPELSSPFRL